MPKASEWRVLAFAAFDIHPLENYLIDLKPKGKPHRDLGTVN